MASQGFKVHPLSERLPQFAPWCRNRTRTRTITWSEEAMFPCGFAVLVLRLLQRRLRLTLWLYVEDAQWSVFPAEGSRSSSVIPLELLYDGGEFGIQRRSASFGPCGRAWSASAGVLLLQVWRRRSGRTDGRSIRLFVRRRGRGTALLVTDGCRAGVGVGTWIRGGGFALGQNTLLHHQWMGPIKQSGPVSHFLFLFVTNKKAAICLLYFAVDDVCDAVKLARWIYTCTSSKINKHDTLGCCFFFSWLKYYWNPEKIYKQFQEEHVRTHSNIRICMWKGLIYLSHLWN